MRALEGACKPLTPFIFNKYPDRSDDGVAIDYRWLYNDSQPIDMVQVASDSSTGLNGGGDFKGHGDKGGEGWVWTPEMHVWAMNGSTVGLFILLV